MKIAIVKSAFNATLVNFLAEGAERTLENYPRQPEFQTFSVPGALELPLMCKWLFDKGYDGVVVLGVVIRGDTLHFELVVNNAHEQLARLSVDYGRPVGFGILACDTTEQAFSRCGIKGGNKGEEAARAVLAMLHSKEKLG